MAKKTYVYQLEVRLPEGSEPGSLNLPLRRRYFSSSAAQQMATRLRGHDAIEGDKP